MGCKTLYQVSWFEVMAFSDEFKTILQDMPEASTAKSVQFGDKTIEGPKEVFLAETMEEVKNELPNIVASLNADCQNIRIIQRLTNCQFCAKNKLKKPGKVIRCSHGKPLVNRAYDVDLQKLLKSRNAA
jgi:hypothetical protein